MYDHYIAVDWAQRNMAIARMTRKSQKIKTIDVPSDIWELKLYLRHLKGTKIITVEESTSAQWLYTELKSEVDEIIVCDPRRNRLLSEGAKNDRIDAEKLVKLLRASLLKPVYHSGDQFLYFRTLVSGYVDTVQAGVRLKNQRSALFRARGKCKRETALEGEAESFVLEGIDERIAAYEEEKNRYEREFTRLSKQHVVLKNLRSLPGIDKINSMKIAARVVDPRRFPGRNHFLSYCGLIRYDCISGGKSYGKRKTNYSRSLKNIFDTAVVSCIQDGANNHLRDLYVYLTEEKRYPDDMARRAVTRRIATLALGVMKSGKRFNPKRYNNVMLTD